MNSSSPSIRSSINLSKDIFQSVLDALPFCVFWKDRDGVFLGCNQAFVHVIDCKSPQDCIGKTDYDFSWTKEEADFFRECDRRVMESGQAEVNIIESLRQADGSISWLETSKVPLTNENGDVIGILAAFHDITERKRLEDENVANQKLDSLGALAAGLAHDFNNILMIVLGSCQLAKMKLTSGSSKSEIIKYLENIEQGTAQASVLTEKFMNYSERGEVTKTVCNLSTMLEEMTALVQSSVNTPITYEVIDREGELYADVNQIHQVLNNLLINASQASTDNSDIIVSLENHHVEASDDSELRPGNYFAIAIKDSGIGISDEYIDDIFKPYFTTKDNGHGLGLSSCLTIVKNHNGTIKVDSTLGIGSTFTVYLPRLQKNQDINPANLPFLDEIVKGRGRILYIEDDQTTLTSTVEMLHELGYQVRSYSALKQAIEYIKQQPNSFDLILTDFILGDDIQGGLTILDSIRLVRPNCPVVLMTGYFKELERRTKAHQQFSYIVQKPIGVAKLSQIIKRFINRADVKNIRPVDSNIQKDHNIADKESDLTLTKNILIVDDEPLIIKFLERYLSFYGYDVISASSGQHALALLSSKTIDLMITDQNMPNMSGIELTKVVKKLFPTMPIIISSGYIDDIGESNIFEFGISHFHKKSSSPEELMTAIAKLLA
ncbi:response regulator [Colwelliaceae bacterium BS250]